MKRLVSLLLIVILALGMFAGCSNDEGKTNPDEGKTPATDSNKPADNKGDKEDKPATPAKDHLVVAVGSPPSTLDPHGTNDGGTTDYKFQMFSALIQLDENSAIQPDLATEWTWEDETTILFKLREGVTFHNGNTFDAEDVMFNLKRAEPLSFTSDIMADVDVANCEVVSPYEFRLKLKNVNPDYIFQLDKLFIVDKETTEQMTDEEMAKSPNGTGPFKYVEWIQGDRVEFEAFENYYGGKPAYNKLTMRLIVEANSRALEIESGGVDIALSIQASDLELLQEVPEVEIHRTAAFSQDYLAFTCTKEPFNNPDFRRAVAYAIDKEAIVNSVFLGVGQLATGPLSPAYGEMYTTDTTIYTRDLAKAKELLAQAGYPDGFSCKLTTGDNSQQRIDICEIVKAQCAEIGLEIEIEILEWATYLNEITEYNLEMFMLGNSGSSPNPVTPIESYLTGQPSWNNTSGYSNPKLDALYDEARYMANGPERKALFVEMQKLIADEVPWIWMRNGEDVFAARSNVNGLVAFPSSKHIFWNVTFD